MKVGYARVSTLEQHLDVQLAKLRQYGCEEIFEEKRSGTDDTRPVLRACLTFVRHGDTLVITKLDRLARSMLHLCTIANQLKTKGVAFQVLDQTVDTTHPTGVLLFQMLGAIAEFEHAIRQERQREGIAAAQARGVRFGRQKALTPVQVGALRAQRRQGTLIKDLMRQYGVKKSAIYRYLQQGQPDALAEAAD